MDICGKYIWNTQCTAGVLYSTNHVGISPGYSWHSVCNLKKCKVLHFYGLFLSLQDLKAILLRISSPLRRVLTFFSSSQTALFVKQKSKIKGLPLDCFSRYCGFANATNVMYIGVCTSQESPSLQAFRVISVCQKTIFWNDIMKYK